jgi:hypothetical protein
LQDISPLYIARDNYQDLIFSNVSRLIPDAFGFLLVAGITPTTTDYINILPIPLDVLSPLTATLAEINRASLTSFPRQSTLLGSSLSSLDAWPVKRSLLLTLLSQETILLSAERYFRNEIVPPATENQIKILLRATQGFIQLKPSDRKVFANLIPQRSGECNKSAISRLQRLYKTLDKTKHYFVKLLYYLYFAYKVRQIPNAEN